MNTEDIEWIFEIRRKAFKLLHDCQGFESDVTGASFDIDDARAYFEEIKETVKQLEQLLAE